MICIAHTRYERARNYRIHYVDARYLDTAAHYCVGLFHGTEGDGGREGRRRVRPPAVARSAFSDRAVDIACLGLGAAIEALMHVRMWEADFGGGGRSLGCEERARENTIFFFFRKAVEIRLAVLTCRERQL